MDPATQLKLLKEDKIIVESKIAELEDALTRASLIEGASVASPASELTADASAPKKFFVKKPAVVGALTTVAGSPAPVTKFVVKKPEGLPMASTSSGGTAAAAASLRSPTNKSYKGNIYRVLDRAAIPISIYEECPTSNMCDAFDTIARKFGCGRITSTAAPYSSLYAKHKCGYTLVPELDGTWGSAFSDFDFASAGFHLVFIADVDKEEHVGGGKLFIEVERPVGVEVLPLLDPTECVTRTRRRAHIRSSIYDTPPHRSAAAAAENAAAGEGDTNAGISLSPKQWANVMALVPECEHDKVQAILDS